jgi:DNA-binding CsgD family transcriptional regulator
VTDKRAELGVLIEDSDQLSRLLAELKVAIERAQHQRGAERTKALADAAELVGQALRRARDFAIELGPAVLGDSVEKLTPRQREVLELIAEGRSTKEIALTLKISVKTAESHRAQLMERLDIRHVAGLVRYAIRSGITRRDV